MNSTEEILSKILLPLSLFVIFSFVSMNIYAAWVDSLPGQITQPDGTKIDVLFSGDEFHNWAHDENGFTIIQDPVTGFWCWATKSTKSITRSGVSEDSGDIESSGMPIHRYTPQSLGLTPRINISNERYLEKRAPFDMASDSRNTRIKRSNTQSSSTGIIQNITVFIRFSDQSEFAAPLSAYDYMFNAHGNSLYQYFWDASYQQLQVHSPFFPLPNGNIIVSYQSPHPRGYFMPYNAVTNPIGFTGIFGVEGSDATLRQHQLLADAVAFIQNQVPANLVIDSNNDGYVDNVCFVVRGDTEAWGSLLWPHRWFLLSYDVYLHGKRVWDYNFNIENHMDHSGVGVLAHEFAHTLGLPDLYRYNLLSWGYDPIGIWDLMSNNTNPPQSISAYMKWKYTDWVTDLPLISTNGIYTLLPNTISQDNHAYRINSPNSSTEYFVVEYRSNRTGLIDSSLPGSGLLVYRVNTLAYDGNAQGPPDELYVYRPNGTLTENGQIENAFFSSQSRRTAINNATNPTPFLSNAQQGRLNINTIESLGASISFNVNIEYFFEPPRYLEASVENGIVYLAWQEPENNQNLTLTGYKVYRNGIAITETISSLYFNDPIDNSSTYAYYVTAIYSDPAGESEPSNPVAMMQGDELAVRNQPRNVNPSTSGNNVDLWWDQPMNSPWFSHSQTETALWENSVGGRSEFVVAHRYTPEQLNRLGIAGAQLLKVGFIGCESSATYTIRVWTGGSGGDTYNAGNMVVNQEVPASSFYSFQWTEILLNTPITIPANQELWIGYHVAGSGGYPAGTDGGPTQGGHGNLIYSDNKWQPITHRNGSIYTNWLIKGYASPATEKSELYVLNPVIDLPMIANPEQNVGKFSLACDEQNDNLLIYKFASNISNNTNTRNNHVIGYNVYRENLLLTPTPITTFNFTDTNVPNGVIKYHVTAVYNNGESPKLSRDVEVMVIDKFPYIQDFSTIPLGWTRASGRLYNYSWLDYVKHNNWNDAWFWKLGNFASNNYTSNDYSYPNGQAAYIGGDQDAQTWLITPEIDLSQNTGECYLSFDIALVPWFGNNSLEIEGKIFSIVISTDNGQTWSSKNTLVRWDNTGNPESRILNNITSEKNGETVYINLSEYTGSVKIGFYGETIAAAHLANLYVDNVAIRNVIPVTNITNVHTTALVGVPLTLTGTVEPSIATNQTIEWSMQYAGTTGATITGNVFHANASGNATIKATVANGLEIGAYYTKFFVINVVDITNLSNIIVYPNPTRGELRFDSGKFRVENLEYSIHSASGQLMMQGKVQGDMINVESLASGVYLLKIAEVTVKFVKE